METSRGLEWVVPGTPRYYDSTGKVPLLSERPARMIDQADAGSEVLQGFLAGSPRAVATVRTWAEAVVRSGGWRFGDPEGVVQDVLLKLVRIVRASGFRESSTFRTFVFSVAKHTCIDVYRTERWRSSFVTDDLPAEMPSGKEADPEESARLGELRELLGYVFQRLPEDCRRLWRWVYGQGLSAEEVSSRLGVSVPNVRVRVHRCLEKARAVGREFSAGPHLG